MKPFGRFLRGFKEAYCHKGGIKALALGDIEPAWFEEIRREVDWIIESQASSNVTDPKHTTNWTKPRGRARQFSLYNPTGKSDEYLSDFTSPKQVPKRLTFPELKGIARFAGLFGDELLNLRLNGLGTSSSLSLHEEDPIVPGPSGRTFYARFHLPIRTSHEARMLLDGEHFAFEAGRLYFFHHGCVHAAVNDASTPRYHFVLDCELTASLFDRLFPGSTRPAPDRGFLPLDEVQARELCVGTPMQFGEFVTVTGRKITGIDYGRRVPSAAQWYRANYPSLFRPIDRLLQRPVGAP